MKEKMYLYELGEVYNPFGFNFTYDEALAVACMQGLYNRGGAKVYVTCRDDDFHRLGIIGTTDWGVPLVRPRCTPMYWLDIFKSEGNWLYDREICKVHGLSELYGLTKEAIKGIVIWDTDVTATVNVATTIAGVEDLIVMSDELYNYFGKETGLPVVHDLRGKFDGSRFGSPNTDAYRWAIENYLDTGKCNLKLVGHYSDSWYNRAHGFTSYVIERDRLVCEKAFVFDLSPWEDFAPENDKNQPLGADKETLLMIFNSVYRQAGGKHMTEFCGFFNARSTIIGQPNGVFSEWELVYLMSPFNFYQNTAANDVYNQSFHKWAPVGELKQHRPEVKKPLENKTYFCMQVCDMDSTTPLYDVMPNLWRDPRRGELPLAWGLDPNLSAILPDVFEYYYKTASKNDYFCSDASAAGYFNPTRIKSENWDMVREHNKYWFEHADMTIAGMVLDDDYPDREIFEHFSKFAPDGFASLITGRHGIKNKPHGELVVNGMPVGNMTLAGCDWRGVEETAQILRDAYFKNLKGDRPQFIYYRLCYRSPSDMFDLYRELQRINPHLDIEIVDPYTYFDLLKRNCSVAD